MTFRSDLTRSSPDALADRAPDAAKRHIDLDIYDSDDTLHRDVAVMVMVLQGLTASSSSVTLAKVLWLSNEHQYSEAMKTRIDPATCTAIDYVYKIILEYPRCHRLPLQAHAAENGYVIASACLIAKTAAWICLKGDH
jgi:hypothetical protein